MNSTGRHKNFAVFASGEGSNAELLFEKFSKGPIRAGILVCNKSQAPVVERAKRHGVRTIIIDNHWHAEGKELIDLLAEDNIQLIVCAGFLLKIPDHIVRAYEGSMINIHPSLLPKFGGKGMYGKRVHEAVLQSGEKESGITIHFVNEHYDEGKIILQEKCSIDSGETIETLSKKIQEMEHRYLPEVVAQFFKDSRFKSRDSEG